MAQAVNISIDGHESPPQQKREEWGEPIVPDDNDDIISVKVVDKRKKDLLTTLSLGISEQIQFPVNTIFMHGLGVIASAMTKSFSYEYHGEESPVNLYVVTSQPPSSGKSGVNKFLANPVRNAFTDYNTGQAKKRALLESRSASLKADLKKATNDAEIECGSVELIELEERLSKIPLYKYAVSNATP